MKKIYLLLIIVIIIIILVSLIFVDIPSPSKLISEEYEIIIK